jgi:uncharacterized protein (DUF885 family)
VKLKFRIKTRHHADGTESYQVERKKGWFWYKLDTDPKISLSDYRTTYHNIDDVHQLILNECRHVQNKLDRKRNKRMVNTSIEIVTKEIRG